MAKHTVTQSPARGVTLDQIDEINQIVSKIIAVADVLGTDGMRDTGDKTIPAIGHDTFLSACRLQELLEGLQPTENAAPVAVRRAAAQPGRPAFSREIHTILVQASAIVQVINTAAYQADGAEGIGGSAWAVTDMLTKVEEYIETSFQVKDGDE